MKEYRKWKIPIFGDDMISWNIIFQQYSSISIHLAMWVGCGGISKSDNKTLKLSAFGIFLDINNESRYLWHPHLESIQFSRIRLATGWFSKVFFVAEIINMFSYQFHSRKSVIGIVQGRSESAPGNTCLRLSSLLTVGWKFPTEETGFFRCSHFQEIDCKQLGHQRKDLENDDKGMI